MDRPFILESDQVVYVDVDDTLVSWSPVHCHEPVLDLPTVKIAHNGVTQTYYRYTENVDSLISHVHKGHTVVVWSGSGFAWARSVVEALNIERFVSAILTKPKWLLDDMKPQDCMPTPYWGAGDPGKAKLK